MTSPDAGLDGPNEGLRALRPPWVTLCRSLCATVLVIGCGFAPADVSRAQEQAAYGLALQGDEAEAFLRAARVIAKQGMKIGITRSDRVTLEEGGRRLRAAWKTIDEHKLGLTTMSTGGAELDFRDSYKHEIAAYELDKLLRLDLVPPTVERSIDGKPGAMQMWVEGVETEHDRRKRGAKPPVGEAWNDQIYKIRLVRQLTYDTDFRNIRNVLVDPAFRLYAIDFSRAFRIQPQLLAASDLTRFSRSVLERLKTLDRDVLEVRLGRWLDRKQLEGLLRRRDRIEALVAQLVVEKGEAAVLYP